MGYVTAVDIINLLENENIYSATGKITMQLNGTDVTIKQNDIVGNALQEWLGQFLKEKGIYFRPASGQTFPDFYLSDDNTKNLCEMKTYLHTRNAAFDIANFYGYVDSLLEHPYRLDSDYIIFAYNSDNDGNISIKKMWCKKVWEITGPAKDYELKCQRKKGQIVNIRPANWKNPEVELMPFNSKEKLIAALYKTHLSTTNQTKISKAWLDAVLTGYRNFSGVDLSSEVKKLI